MRKSITGYGCYHARLYVNHSDAVVLVFRDQDIALPINRNPRWSYMSVRGRTAVSSEARCAVARNRPQNAVRVDSTQPSRSCKEKSTVVISKFAVPDASRLTEMLANSQQELGTYGKVVPVQLLDEQATRANIVLALSRLGGQQSGALPAGAPTQLAALERVQPEDTVVVYFAGHGAAFGDRYYLIPHDLDYHDRRADLAASLDKVLANSISDQDLERAFEPVDAAHLMLIIDACNSGKALDSEDDRRGPLNNKGLAQLAYEKGMYVMTAAQAYQAAIESSRLGHGYLTYALVEEGLTSSVADVQPKDGQITALEWFEYATKRVPQLEMEALTEAAANRRALVFVGAPKPDIAVGDLQTPRLYYRRDDTLPSPVIAKR